MIGSKRSLSTLALCAPALCAPALCALGLVALATWPATGHAQADAAADVAPLPAEATGLNTHPLFEAGDTALIGARTWQVGVFGPLRWRMDERTEVSGHPLLFFVAPNVTLKRQVWHGDELTVALRGGLGVPTGLLKLAQTQFWGDQYTIGWMLSFDVAAIATWQPAGTPLALSLHLRERWAPTLLGETDIVHNDTPLLEESVAHITDGPTTIIGLDLDIYLSESLALFADVDMQWSPAAGPHADDTNIDLRGKLMGAYAWSSGLSTSLGLMWVSSRLDHRRLSGFLPIPAIGIPLPLVDVIWRW